MQEAQQAPAFMRANTVELRGECPRDIVNALDAISMARDITRTQLVNEILGDWATLRRHESTLLQRLDSANPPAAEARGGQR